MSEKRAVRVFTPDERLAMGHDLRARFTQIMRELEPGVQTDYGTAGGGTMVVFVELPSGYTLVSPLESDRGTDQHTWCGWDLRDPEGEALAVFELYARPLFGADPADPAEVHVNEMRRLIGAFRGDAP